MTNFFFNSVEDMETLKEKVRKEQRENLCHYLFIDEISNKKLMFCEILC